MEDQKDKAFIFLPSLMIGMEDSVSPCALAAMIVFLSFLFLAARTKKEAGWLSGGFIFAVFVTKICIVFGSFDPLLSLPAVNAAIRYGYLLTGIVFMIVGAIHCRDWLVSGKTGHPGDIFRFPLSGVWEKMRHPSVPQKRKISRLIRNMAGALLLGHLLTLMGSVWYRDYHLFVYFLQLAKKFDGGVAFQSVFWANIIFVMPLVLVTGLFMISLYSNDVLTAIRDNGAKCKMIAALSFITVGAGLTFAFIH